MNAELFIETKFYRRKILIRIYTANQEGLEKAITFLRSFCNTKGRLPKSTDKEMRAIKSGIARKRWVQFGIKTWNDLMIKSFNKINVEREIYSKDKEGLNKAVSKLQEFFKTQKKYPKSTDEGMGTIVGAIHHKKRWRKFGVNRWKDLFILAFGKDTQRSIYDGEEGLEFAKRKLQEFRDKHKRLPKYADKEMNPIRHAATTGKWAAFGIKKWNDLLRLTFTEVNYESGIWRGEEGLTRAKNEIIDFIAKNGRKPTTRDEGMKGIVGAIRREYWLHLKIESWNDLLEMCFDVPRLNSVKEK
ncbi:MAG: hypothetical protein ACFFAE_02410 [Candidatus Hodarchaeota archaeon]